MITRFEHPAYLLLWIVVLVLVIMCMAFMYTQTQSLTQYALKQQWSRLGIKVFPWKKIIPLSLFFVSIFAAVGAVAGPIGKNKTPRSRATVVIALDISGSMNAKDVSPSRLSLAVATTKKFINETSRKINIGLVTFNSDATGILTPTENRESLYHALDSLHAKGGTATGSAINQSRKMITKFHKELQLHNDDTPGYIVLISDGKQTVPTENINEAGGAALAARSAQQANIKIFPIAIGTKSGVVTVDHETIKVPVDTQTLDKIAELSGGIVLRSGDGGDLDRNYSKIAQQIAYSTIEAPKPFPWVLTSLISLLTAICMSLYFNRRVF